MNFLIVRGVKMAVDGTDPELIQQIMDTELEALMDRHAQGKAMLDTVGKYAPAFGMIGTLLGLIFMLSNMDDPSKIGPGMAVALIVVVVMGVTSLLKPPSPIIPDIKTVSDGKGRRVMVVQD